MFESFGRETTKKYTKQGIEDILSQLDDSEKFGIILRAKGIVESENGEFIHFDYIPSSPDVRFGSSEAIGKICVIGSKINHDEIARLFGI